MEFYKTEVAVAVGMTARMGTTPAVTGACVHGAQVLVVVEAFDPIVTWSPFSNSCMLAFCSCSGVLGNGRSAFTEVVMEYPQMQAALRRRSTCRHALALLRAYDSMAIDVGATTYFDFCTMLSMTLGQHRSDERDEELAPTITYHVLMAGRRRNVPIYAVRYDSMCTAVFIRPTSNKFKLATCCQLSCKSRPWGCIHAKAVNKNTLVDAESVAVRAEMDRENGLSLGPDGVLDKEKPRFAAPGAARRAAVATPVPKPDKLPQQRRARKLIPCAAEAALWDAYSAAVDSFRDGGEFRQLERVHLEPEFRVCGLPSRGRDIQT